MSEKSGEALPEPQPVPKRVPESVVLAPAPLPVQVDGRSPQLRMRRVSWQPAVGADREDEFDLITLTHNLLKLFRSQRCLVPIPPA